jgi:hypothetical protein
VLVSLLSAGLAVTAGCSSSQSPEKGTVHGHVSLDGGPALPGRSDVQTGHGSVLVFDDANRVGRPVLSVRIDASGNYTFHARVGRYYLATTAATFNGDPARGPSVAVAVGGDLRADIEVPIK